MKSEVGDTFLCHELAAKIACQIVFEKSKFYLFLLKWNQLIEDIMNLYTMFI